MENNIKKNKVALAKDEEIVKRKEKKRDKMNRI